MLSREVEIVARLVERERGDLRRAQGSRGPRPIARDNRMRRVPVVDERNRRADAHPRAVGVEGELVHAVAVTVRGGLLQGGGFDLVRVLDGACDLLPRGRRNRWGRRELASEREGPDLCAGDECHVLLAVDRIAHRRAIAAEEIALEFPQCLTRAGIVCLQRAVPSLVKHETAGGAERTAVAFVSGTLEIGQLLLPDYLAVAAIDGGDNGSGCWVTRNALTHTVRVDFSEVGIFSGTAAPQQ